ncbi:hypothetical protein FH972_014618 [Carpinus fangiana]|uniref:E2 ubiquitin-conjugating enzyme n=1 Tax=Carpinus fangiana TaxID=176857 RepID=A0A5N6RD05_9ROSI|nr:hypothetical protein FH972_014618 [Carpinus fangiana]
MDLDVEGNASGTPQTLISKKLQHSAVDDSKGKTKINYEGTWQDQVKDASASDPGNSTVVGSLDSVDPLKSTTSIIPTESSSKEKEEENGDAVMGDVLQFKQFDIGDDFSDHHYGRMGFSDEKAPKNWAKRIQDEWKMLEKNLPDDSSPLPLTDSSSADTIFVRVYEVRMELLRAVMIGPAGTPYHDGLFVFDCLFPATYPSSPPMVYYYSGGLRLNPNLYDCGKVCLSLLGTWTGKPNEMWIPEKSTMLQVLVSIQALILNAKPFFNEPGYEKTYIGPEGERRSLAYNENAFILSLKTMIYTLRRPPKHFEDFVASHFRIRARNILAACKAYMEGAPVGFVEGAEDNAGGDPKSIEFKSKVDKMMNMMPGGDPKSIEFKSKLGKMMNLLVTSFTKNGSTDIEQFRLPA